MLEIEKVRGWIYIYFSSKTDFLLQELPKRISTTEEAEILQLLCRTHELEIAKVEMQSDALLQQHEVRRRDLLLLKYDRQRNLMDEIIQRQRALIEGEQKYKCAERARFNRGVGVR